MIEPIIRVNNLKIVYNEGKANEYYALRGESLEIYPREYIILFGPSGCGKSTLLYSLLGILAPSSGEVLIKGENPYKYDWRQMVKFQQSTVGIIYQSFNLIPSLTVLDNVALPLIFAGLSKSERDKQAMALLKRFGVDQHAHKLGTNLSGGQMQRVAVARSLVNDPEILFADEPVGNLDSISSDQVMGTLEEINMKDQKTVILVTHDAKLLPYAHRVYYLKDGAVEREVMNPEKKQIKQTDPGTSILSEIEKLARIYPYATPNELRVKSIVNFLTQDIGFDQIERLERCVGMFIDGKFTDETLVATLRKAVEDGGPELSKERADIFREKLSIILKEAREIRSYRDNFRAKVSSPRQAERLAEVRSDLVRECGLSLSAEQAERLEELLKFRIRGFIQQEDFRRRFETPFEDGGVGVGSEAARIGSWYLEKLIGQGMYL
ncbi:MAG TPA: ABC transporter ATP-binding protein [Candidatus Paceibacterota bacterium]|nr:ABC transporter ATP-binding protein [Candidatus Paceibacterota bacterium]